ncbi:MAG: 3-deoxy-manno-octulosonate cytidylyltransferase (CMP-KDO synthetase) [Granulosicoccus sp.]|jgi:3-deoxy-manno-octulosonate cytidylyltransferase (CMP-KDO synthetase)
MPFTVVIPARFSSTRLPGKPLLLIDGKPMVQRVYEQALKSDAEQVIIATDDQRIVDAVIAFGGNVCMTSDKHISGTDRIQEVAQQYALSDDHIVVNVQGDEPCIPPAVINQVAINLANNNFAAAATLSEKITNVAEFLNPNVVKVVFNEAQMALYFSRAPIPFPRDAMAKNANLQTMVMDEMSPSPQRHIGIYAYRVSLLHAFVTWAPAPLEKSECLEQLRILHYGKHIQVAEACENVPAGIDTQEDIDRVRQDF